MTSTIGPACVLNLASVQECERGRDLRRDRNALADAQVADGQMRAEVYGYSSDSGWMEQNSVNTTPQPPSAFIPRRWA